MKKRAFTLAELMITLTIIGIIAVLSIPSIMAHTQQHEYKTGLKKAVEALNTAISLNIAVENESPYDNGNLYGYFKRHMNVLKEVRNIGDVYTVAGAATANSAFYTMDGMRYEFNASGATTGKPLYEDDTVTVCAKATNHEKWDNPDLFEGEPGEWVSKKNPSSAARNDICLRCGSAGLHNNSKNNMFPPCLIMVDVNGDRKPNPANASCKTSGGAQGCTPEAYKYSDGTKLTDLFSLMVTDTEVVPYGIAAQKAMYGGKSGFTKGGSANREEFVDRDAEGDNMSSGERPEGNTANNNSNPGGNGGNTNPGDNSGTDDGFGNGGSGSGTGGSGSGDGGESGNGENGNGGDGGNGGNGGNGEGGSGDDSGNGSGGGPGDSTVNPADKSCDQLLSGNMCYADGLNMPCQKFTGATSGAEYEKCLTDARNTCNNCPRGGMTQEQCTTTCTNNENKCKSDCEKTGDKLKAHCNTMIAFIYPGVTCSIIGTKKYKCNKNGREQSSASNMYKGCITNPANGCKNELCVNSGYASFNSCNRSLGCNR